MYPSARPFISDLQCLPALTPSSCHIREWSYIILLLQWWCFRMNKCCPFLNSANVIAPGLLALTIERKLVLFLVKPSFKLYLWRDWRPPSEPAPQRRGRVAGGSSPLPSPWTPCWPSTCSACPDCPLGFQQAVELMGFSFTKDSQPLEAMQKEERHSPQFPPPDLAQLD